ncbi:MAG: 4Fe-4S binding protein [Lachnospiraceae bacterium]|nr:4Fe-4S binding protein [Lachnospiraceae bacterium]
MKVSKKENCYGCTACMCACPTHAIIMQSDDQGFLYPQINEKQCIHCGICENVCPYKEKESTRITALQKVYAVKNKDELIRLNSSSGGFFYELAEYVRQKEGVVYGAVFDEEFKVVHMRGTSKEDIHKMQRAKYVQSDLNNIFDLVKKDLLEDKTVLFTGCPCQVDGLIHYLKDCKHENLITCDLVCHGVNSPKIWRDYLTYLKREEEIVNISFRDKSLGWRKSSMHIQMKHKDYLENANYDCFFQAFFSGLGLRPSCFVCKYTNLKRKSDITMGDFWGIEQVFPELDDNKGTSLILLNSDKGEMVFSNIEKHFNSGKTTVERCMQPSLELPRKRPQQYEIFWKDYIHKKGYSFVERKYLNGGMKGKAKRIVKKVLIEIGFWQES